MGDLQIRPTRRPRYYGGSNKTGQIARTQEIADGVVIYDVRVNHAASGANILLQNVREGVNTFYENEAGAYEVGDFVTVQRESRGLWVIIKRIPDPTHYPNPTSVLNVGRGSVVIDDRGVVMQFGELYSEHSENRVATQGPAVDMIMDNNHYQVSNDTSIMELREEGAFEVRKNAPKSDRKFYVLGYPVSGLPADRNDFVLVSDASQTYSTTTASVDSHDHDIPPHTHVVQLRPINALVTLQTDDNSLFYDAFTGEEPTLSAPSFTVEYERYTPGIFSGSLRRGRGQTTRRTINISAFNDDYTYERSIIRRSSITRGEDIDRVLRGQPIDNIWVDDTPQTDREDEVPSVSVRGVVNELLRISFFGLFGGTVRIESGGLVEVDNYKVATEGIGEPADNKVSIILNAPQSADRIVPIDWLPNLAGGITPSADNISAIALYGHRIRIRSKDIPHLVSEWTYRMGIIVIPANGYTF